MRKKTIGVLGGMGPESTVDFFNLLVALTPAEKDQDHFHIIIDNNPNIPDRTEAILNNDNTAVIKALVCTAKNLEAAGADFIVMPCNTAHYFIKYIQEALAIPVLDMVDEVIMTIKLELPECKKVGILATTGTIVTRLYQDRCQRAQLDVLTPDEKDQGSVMKSIYLLKAKKKPQAREILMKQANQLVNKGADCLILGCTEIPLVLQEKEFTVPLYNATRILALAAIKFAISTT
jgi:aspartate racemase